MDNQEEMEEFLEKYNLLRLNEEEIQNVNIPQLLLIIQAISLSLTDTVTLMQPTASILASFQIDSSQRNTNKEMQLAFCIPRFHVNGFNQVRMENSLGLLQHHTSKVLDLYAFDSLSGISLQKKLQHVPTTQPHLDQSIITVTFEVPGNAEEESLNVYIQNLLWEKNVRNRDDACMEVIRLKGLVSIKDKPQQVIVQGVHELYDLEETPVNWEDDSERTNRLVLIGRNLDKDILKQLFIATVTETEKRWTTHFQEDQVCP
ncbi:PREDICTED: putative COBW domain-containing protein 7 [Bison bison bison]|uniref:COBW domain-containing protein 7 n=1 Tax=Bison bison bison TaxID=43346 RepID=A0A6P3H7M6_BISBB|nr:PREDICTED: putative COBW domain-containing protein 7 [Bison bison bison]